eukprot:gene11994-5394_t
MDTFQENDDIFGETFKFAILTNSKGEIMFSQYYDESVAQKENDIEYCLQNYLSKTQKFPDIYCKRVALENSEIGFVFINNLKLDCKQYLENLLLERHKKYSISNFNMLNKFKKIEDAIFSDNFDDYEIMETLLTNESVDPKKTISKMNLKLDNEIKLLLKSFDFENSENFELEKNLDKLLKMDHPNVISIKKWFKIDSKYHILSTFMEKGNVYDDFNKRFEPISEKELINMTKQICQGLKYLHAKGFFGRITPQKLLLSKQGDIKISGFEIDHKLDENEVMYQLGITLLQISTKEKEEKLKDEKYQKKVLSNLKENIYDIYKICKGCLSKKSKEKMNLNQILSFIEAKKSVFIDSPTFYLPKKFFNQNYFYEVILINDSKDNYAFRFQNQKNSTEGFIEKNSRVELVFPYDANVVIETVKVKHSTDSTFSKLFNEKKISYHPINFVDIPHFYHTKFRLVSEKYYIISNMNRNKQQIEREIEWSFNINSDEIQYDLMNYEEETFDIEDTMKILTNNFDKNEIVNYFELMKHLNTYFKFLLIVMYSNEGMADAQYYLAQKYQQGIDIEKDEKKAFNLYLKSANQGNLDAQYYVGYCYQNGIGVDKNIKKAIMYYDYSAIGGNENSKLQLGNLFFLDKNYTNSYEIFQALAKEGNPDALNKLGIFYKEGIIVDKSAKRAKELFEESSSKGHSDAQNSLGNLYYHGDGIEQDFNKAFEYYSKSAVQGNPLGQKNVGICFQNGHGVNQNDKLAFEYFEKSANQGNSDAQMFLGLCYYLGKGKSINKQKAVELFEKSKNQGNSKSKHILEVIQEYEDPKEGTDSHIDSDSEIEETDSNSETSSETENLIENYQKEIEKIKEQKEKEILELKESLKLLSEEKDKEIQKLKKEFDSIKNSNQNQINETVELPNNNEKNANIILDEIIEEFKNAPPLSIKNQTESETSPTVTNKNMNFEILKKEMDEIKNQKEKETEYLESILKEKDLEIQKSSDELKNIGEKEKMIEELSKEKKKLLEEINKLNIEISLISSKEDNISEKELLMKQQNKTINESFIQIEKLQTELNQSKERENKLNFLLNEKEIQIQNLQEKINETMKEKEKEIISINEQKEIEISSIVSNKVDKNIFEEIQQKNDDLMIHNEKLTEEVNILKNDVNMLTSQEKENESNSESIKSLIQQKNKEIEELKIEISSIKNEREKDITLSNEKFDLYSKERNIEILKLKNELTSLKSEKETENEILKKENESKIQKLIEENNCEIQKLNIEHQSKYDEGLEEINILKMKNLNLLNEMNELKNINSSNLIKQIEKENELKKEYEKNIENQQNEIQHIKKNNVAVQQEKEHLEIEMEKLKIESDLEIKKLKEELKKKMKPLDTGKIMRYDSMLSPRSKKVPKINEPKRDEKVLPEEDEKFEDVIPIPREKKRRKSLVDINLNGDQIKHEFNYGPESPDSKESNGWKTVTSTLINKKQVDKLFNQMKKDKCVACDKNVYATEKITAGKNQYHERCFKCSVCKKKLTILNYVISNGENQALYCKNHAKIVSLSKITKK